MQAILDMAGGLPVRTFHEGASLLVEGERSGRMYILRSGAVEVLRADTVVTALDEPGALLGEMAALLDGRHTASVRALGTVEVYAVEDASAFFRTHPEFAFLVARVLARRLAAATTYVADLRRQYAGAGAHLEIVGEVLDALILHDGGDIDPGSERDPGF